MILPEYKKHKDHDIRISSARVVIKTLLNTEIYLPYKKELLSICLWKITEVDGKYKTRYISELAILESNKAKLNHEHVYERKFIIDELLKRPDNIERILLNVIACTVTKDEHEKLTKISKVKNLQGWDRYKAAKIKVFDLLKQEELTM